MAENDLQQVAIAQGTYHVQGDGWTADLEVPSDITLAHIAQAMQTLRRGNDQRHK